MKIFSFENHLAHPIEQFGTQGVALVRIAELDESSRIGYFRIAPGGVIGHHQTTTDQLFMVLQGHGWVRGGEGEIVPIRAGHAAFWTAGEWHESGSETGMEAVVIEVSGGNFDPANHLQEIQE
jgi:quercetin dioxygenase-like cupin family protein